MTVRLEGAAGDDMRSLRDWLVEEDELRGRVRLVEVPPAPGELGPLLDALNIALESGGAATTLATIAVAWIRSRHTDITVTAEHSTGSIRIEGRQVRRLDATAIQSLIEQTGRALDSTRPTAHDVDAAGSGDPAGQPSAGKDRPGSTTAG
ncbi:MULTISPECIES: effector-associated constant component EACC1 [unclassified Frankia]|uniref:effector-associated constant component EACC1 n=1 Tax=unclassified Frankia TaxID=2632575 RepID=UPI002AD42623|nr:MULTISPECIES: hypothetical protein [unclassified Frankia]